MLRNDPGKPGIIARAAALPQRAVVRRCRRSFERVGGSAAAPGRMSDEAGWAGLRSEYSSIERIGGESNGD